jgi:hypothetical protein
MFPVVQARLMKLPQAKTLTLPVAQSMLMKILLWALPVVMTRLQQPL